MFSACERSDKIRFTEQCRLKIKKICKLRLNGNTAAAAVGAVISIPLAKSIMDELYPGFAANVSCVSDIAFPRIYTRDCSAPL